MIEKLPDGWKVEKLGDLCKFMNGYAFSSKDYVEYSNVVNIRMSNIRPNASFNYLHNVKYLPEEYAEKYKQFQLNNNDVILAMTDMGKSMNILGVPTEVKKPDRLIFLLNQRVGKLFDFDLNKISTSYIKKVLSTEYIHNFYKQLGGGGLQINLSKKDILLAEIPIPPLPQQEKIVKVLDISSALIEKQKKLIKNYDLFLKSKFIEMFGDPIKNPFAWEVEKLGDVCKNKGEYGSGASAVEYDKSKPRYLRITDILESGYLIKNKKSPSIIEEKYYMNKGDIVFARSGATVGKTYLHRNDDNLLFAGYLIRFIPNHAKLNPTFLFHFTKTSFYNSWILSKQKVVAQPNINAKEYSALNIYLPPITLQNKFSSIVEKIELIKEKENKKLKSLQTLHDSLMQKAFKGEIG